jgi:hypothetical protein
VSEESASRVLDVSWRIERPYSLSERSLLQDPHSLVCKEVIATFPPHLVASGILTMSVTEIFRQLCGDGR